MITTEYDMFENTGHEDMVFGLCSIEEAIDNMDACEETIPELFDDSILQKEEPVPFQNKICHTKERVSSQQARPETDSITESSVSTLNYIRQLNAEKMHDKFAAEEAKERKAGNKQAAPAKPEPKRIKAEKVEDINLFYARTRSKTITVNRNSFTPDFKPRLIEKRLKVNIAAIPGYHRMTQQAQAVLDDINELRREANVPEWTMTTLLTTNIESVDDFLSVSFSKRKEDEHWDAHEVVGAETQYEEYSNEYRFFYIPETDGNDFDKKVQQILKDCEVVDVVSLAKKVYKLPELICFSTKGLTANLTTGYKKVSYLHEGNNLYITFPWMEGIKFSSVNYDREYFRIS